jgi:hypothetical protein
MSKNSRNVPGKGAPSMFPQQGATLQFPCGVGRVASRLLSTLEGLDHSVIFVGGP